MSRYQVFSRQFGVLEKSDRHLLLSADRNPTQCPLYATMGGSTNPFAAAMAMAAGFASKARVRFPLEVDYKELGVAMASRKIRGTVLDALTNEYLIESDTDGYRIDKMERGVRSLLSKSPALAPLVVGYLCELERRNQYASQEVLRAYQEKLFGE